VNDDQNNKQLFDEWAISYDASVGGEDFPFIGYAQLLDTIVRLAGVGPGMSVLDLGTGTGNLAARFAALGCEVWGTDFSAAMLAKARAKLPRMKLVQADLSGEWPDALARRFDRIVSAYVLHHFDLAGKVDLLTRLAHNHLAAGGRLGIGDVAFRDGEARAQAHARWAQSWDESEFYWAADETRDACAAAGLRAAYTQVSSCGGVFVVELPG
jgi:cyclopropane fatty-acyl-phospholipid synthase-like methyltransferase